MAKKETNQTELNITTEYNKNITDFFGIKATRPIGELAL